MFEILRPEKDTTIYGHAPRLNSGIDEILELNVETEYEPFVDEGDKVEDPVFASRILLAFEDPGVDFNKPGILGSGSPNAFANFGVETSDVPVGVVDPTNEGKNAFADFGTRRAPERSPDEEEEEMNREPDADVWLRLWFAEGSGLPQDYEIEILSLEKTWREGTGRRNNVPPTKIPANWLEAQESVAWTDRGGDFDTGSSVVQPFGLGDSPDLFVKINELFNNGNPENGFLLKRSDESGTGSELKFFSRQTNTVFVPHALVGTETFVHEVSDDAEEFENTDEMSVFITNLRDSYPQAKTRFNVKVRDKFARREFLGVRPSERGGPEVDPFLPPRALFYEVQDRRTGEPIFPFSDPYTAVSYESGRHFFDLDLSNLFPRRAYEIIFKFINPDTGNEQTFNPQQTFELEQR